MAISDELWCCACVTFQPINGQLKLAVTFMKSFSRNLVPRVRDLTEGIPGGEDDFPSQFPGCYLFRFVI